jgi:monoamine oxidase
MKITRRQFGGFAAALPFTAAAAVNDPDVVIVGAGAAGIAAAQVLVNGGRRVQVLEAAPRIGGRCYTDRATLGVPFDAGASWLHNADKNPLTGLAQLYGFETKPHDPRETLFTSGRFDPHQSNADYARAYKTLSEALSEAAEGEDDLAASNVALPALDEAAHRWLPTAAAAIGPLAMGVDFAQMSVKDWYELDDEEPNRLVREGLGTLVGRMGVGLPIAVNTPVRSIASEGRGVRVVTTRGILRARVAIVTVSTGVLAAGTIAFEPAFSSELQAGLGALQMGLLSKIALAFAPHSPALKYGEGSVLVPQVASERGYYFLIRPYGVPIAICLVGGSLAWELAQQNEAANIAFARDRLRALLGANADRGFRAGAATRWGQNPLTLGSYAVALPGMWRARNALGAPIGGRVFLAGEALAGKAATTAHGAYVSGQTVGRRVLQSLKT